MSLSRRSAMLGSTLGLAAIFAAGFTYRAYSRGVFGLGVDDAYAPWRDFAEAPLNGPLAVAGAGLLASSVHNSQPWLFHVENDRIALYADRTRHVGTVDPFRREMILSLGCALANMELAARAQGFESTVAYLGGRLDESVAVAMDSLGGLDPTSDLSAALEPLHVATLYLAPGATVHDPLFDAIPLRHTNRHKFDADRRVSLPLQALLQNEVPAEGPPVRLILFGPGDGRDRLSNLIESAAEALTADPQMAADGARWFRYERAAVLEHRDGIAFNTTGSESFLDGALGRIFNSPEPTVEDGSWPQKSSALHVRKAPLLGMIAVRDLYDLENTLAAGRLWQRLHLMMTAQGLSAQPLNQPIQLGDRDVALGRPSAVGQQLAEIIDDEDWHPTLLFRAGYATEPGDASPRRSLEDVMMA